jgi:LCP family protein required for cell wall assembly
MVPPSDGDNYGPSGAQPPKPADGGARRRPADAALPPHLDPRRGGAGGGSGAGGPGGTGPGDPRPRRRLRWFVGGTTGVVVLVIVFVVASALIALAKIGHVCITCGYQQAPDRASGDLNVLVVGSDSRAGLSHAQQQRLHVGHDAGQRTDTMMLVHIPAGAGKATIVSLPRDSYVTIPAHTDNGHQVPAARNKLNAAFAEGGPDLLTHTVEASTGVPIDHYVQIDFEGFVAMVDAVGGVDVCTDSPINDPVRYDASTGGYVGSGLRLPAGSSHVNGVTALEYVRAREFDPTEDLGRMRRQQEFIADLIHRVESTGVLLDPKRIYDLLQAVGASLKTDPGFGVHDMYTLVQRLHSMSPKNVQMMTVPLANPENPSVEEPIGGVETSVVRWDPRQAKTLFGDLDADKPVDNLVKASRVTVAPSAISLRVLNATTTNGLAAKAASQLSGRGFRVSGTGNAPTGSDPSKTVVLYGSGRAQSAQTVAASVPGATRQLDSRLGASGIELVLGSGFHGTAAVKVATARTPTINTAAGKQCQTD